MSVAYVETLRSGRRCDYPQGMPAIPSSRGAIPQKSWSNLALVQARVHRDQWPGRAGQDLRRRRLSPGSVYPECESRAYGANVITRLRTPRPQARGRNSVPVGPHGLRPPVAAIPPPRPRLGTSAPDRPKTNSRPRPSFVGTYRRRAVRSPFAKTVDIHAARHSILTATSRRFPLSRQRVAIEPPTRSRHHPPHPPHPHPRPITSSGNPSTIPSRSASVTIPTSFPSSTTGRHPILCDRSSRAASCTRSAGPIVAVGSCMI